MNELDFAHLIRDVTWLLSYFTCSLAWPYIVRIAQCIFESRPHNWTSEIRPHFCCPKDGFNCKVPLYSNPQYNTPLTSLIRLQSACQHTDECRLSRPILSQHDQDLRVSKLTTINAQVEITCETQHIKHLRSEVKRSSHALRHTLQTLRSSVQHNYKSSLVVTLWEQIAARQYSEFNHQSQVDRENQTGYSAIRVTWITLLLPTLLTPIAYSFKGICRHSDV